MMESAKSFEKSTQYWKDLSGHSGLQSSLHCIPREYQEPRCETSIETASGISEAIFQFCRRCDVEAHDLIYGAWAIVSARHMTGNQQNTAFTVTGRKQPLLTNQDENGETENDFPMIVEINENLDALSWTRQMRILGVEASSHAHIGYKQILDNLSACAPQSRISVNRQRDTTTTITGSVIDLDITITEDFQIRARHNSNIPKGDIRVLLEHFYTILQQTLDMQDTAIGELQMMGMTEMQLLYRHGKAYQSPSSGLVQSLIERQAELTPDADAVQFEKEKPLTFSELNFVANQLARQIRGHVSTIVPVHMRASTSLIVAILAILKAGAAYVVLDPDSTAARRSYIIEDTRAEVILVDQTTAGHYSNELKIEELLKQSEGQSGDNFIANQSDSDTAYIIYTSGSSGNPKAAELDHHAVFNGLRAFPRKQGLRQLLFYNPVFSAAQRSIWATLSVGGCLCLATKPNLTVQLADTIKTMQINAIDMTSTTAALISPDQVPSLQRLVLGGEMVSAAVVQKWAHHVELFSSYGLSECTQLNWRCRLLAHGNTKNIDKPFDTTTSYILTTGTVDISPLLVPGELCLGGDQLAKGYLNLPDLTAERFMKNPFGDGRLYRTGDMAVRHADGAIELLGRIDFQVKINGQRIEPGEPNSIIQSCEQVENSAVVPAFVNKKVHLAAVVIRRNGSDDDDWNSFVERLRSLLRSSIPAYMVPSFWISASELPLNANGKVDMRAVRDLVEDIDKAGGLLPNGARTNDESNTISQNEATIIMLCSDLLSIPESHISLGESFISLGGTSLEAIQLVSRLRSEFDLLLQIEDILLGHSLSHIANNIKPGFEGTTSENIQSSNRFTPLRHSLDLTGLDINYDEIEDVYPVTPFQEAAIADTFMGGKNYIYSRFYRFDGYSLSNIRDGLEALTRSEALLRTTFVPNASTFLQVVKKTAKTPWEEILNEDVTGYVQNHGARPMQSGQIWWRTAILAGNVLAITAHHALFDYWSNEFLPQDLTAILNGRLSIPRPPFRSYVVHLHTYDDHIMKTFWNKYLQGAEPRPLGPCTDNEVTVTSKLHSNLKARASGFSVTPSVLLYAAWSLALATVSAINSTSTLDVVFGITISGRDAPIADIMHMNGPTIMIAPLRVRMEMSKSFKDHVQNVQDNLWKTAKHAQYGLRNILRASEQGKGIVDSMVNFLFKASNNEHKKITNGERGLVPLKDKGLGNVENVKLEFANDQPDRVILESKLDSNFAQELVDLVSRILDSAEKETQISELLVRRTASISTTLDVNVPELKPCHGPPSENMSHIVDTPFTNDHADHSVTSVPELSSPFAKYESPGVRSLCYDLNYKHRTSKTNDVPRELAHSAFQRVAALYPGKVAVQNVSGSRLTYAGLSIKANRLAGLLESKGIELDQVVPIMLEKSINTVVAIFGILVAGGAFLPLGPENPTQRNLGILDDLEGTIAIADRANATFFADAGFEVIVIDEIEWDTMPLEGHIVSGLKPSNLAYVIYTSGSTGKPKGTLLMHEGVAAATNAINQATQTDMRHKFLWVPNYTFDGSLDTLFTCLSIGATLCVAPQSEIAANLTGLINAMDINRANMTPSMTTLINPREVPSLKVLLTGGEAMTPQIVAAWWPRVRIYNSYGPTEATISISTKRVEMGMNLRNVGQPYDSVTAMVLDPDTMQPVIYGDIGELCVAGPQLARGYLKRPEATQQVFIKGPHGIVYRTGDMARLLPNGDIELFGRRDDQVKINGYRIELEEIESVVRRTGLFEKCVVVAATVLKRRQLVALYTNCSQAGKEESDLKAGFCLPPHDQTQLEQAKGQLSTIPTYMVPTIWLPVATFPLSPAGKVDKKTLRSLVEKMTDLELKSYLPKEEEAECATESELVLQSLWSELFSTPKENIHANSSFHAFGGDSISALSLVSMLRRHGHDLKVSDIVTKATLKQQAALIDESVDSGATVAAPQSLQYRAPKTVHDYLSSIGISRDEVEDIYPCSPGQIEFLTQGNKKDQFWQLMAIRELPSELNFDRWIELTRRLTRKNQILRALYLYTDRDDPQTAIQVVLKDPELNLRYQSFTTSEEKRRILAEEWDARFDVTRPFVRYTCLLDTTTGKRHLVVKLDHASYDGTLLHLFDAQFKAMAKDLPIAKIVPFKTFISHILSQPKQPQLDYWKDLLRNKTCTFPKTTLDPKITETASTRINVSLEIDTIATTIGVTSPIMFQTAFSLLLAHLSGKHEVIYDNLITGRNVAIDNPQLINGNCANFVPFYSCIEAQKPVAELLRDTQSAFWTNSENALVSLGEIYASMGEERSVAAAKSLFCFQPFEPVTGDQDSMRWIVMKMSKVTMFFNYAIQLEVLKATTKGEYVVRLGYDGRIFTKEEVQRALTWYVECLKRMGQGGTVSNLGL